MNKAPTELLLAVASGGLFFGGRFIFIGWRLWQEGRELHRGRTTGTGAIIAVEATRFKTELPSAPH